MKSSGTNCENFNTRNRIPRTAGTKNFHEPLYIRSFENQVCSIIGIITKEQIVRSYRTPIPNVPAIEDKLQVKATEEYASSMQRVMKVMTRYTRDRMTTGRNLAFRTFNKELEGRILGVLSTDG